MSRFKRNNQFDECVILRKGSNSLLVHWYVSNITKEMVKESCGLKVNEKNMVVVIYDVTNIAFNGHNAHKLKIYRNRKQRSRGFIPHLPLGRTYIVDVGIYTKKGHLFSFIRSNEIHLEDSKGFSRNCKIKWSYPTNQTPKWEETFSVYSCYTMDTKIIKQNRRNVALLKSHRYV